ncbi:MAG: hypothetical protein MUO63_19875, partial [Desulfobulbaceae bacterium]|nr:hypothetical protein [Desulfobulbaceae bacterium]
GAMADAEQSVTYADRSGDAFWKMASRCKIADAQHQAGRRTEAQARFREAEQMQTEFQPDYPLLYSLRGFRYCDLLLTEAEREAGKANQRPEARRQRTELVEVCRAVSERAAQTRKLEEGMRGAPLLDFALHNLTLGRATLYCAILEQADFRLPAPDLSHIDRAVAGLRRAGEQIWLTAGLLTRAWLRSLTGLRTGPESAQSDLDEAWEIAERGPMPLFMADIHLYRARLFCREATYPWGSPQADLASARRLIEKHGYLRRKEELDDAEEAIKPGQTGGVANVAD